MNKKNETKLFAFKISAKSQSIKTQEQWKVRDGVSTAGCTGWELRGYDRWGREQGVIC
ncbi:hypothetical protein [Kangiella taiwanensis]|uniref:Uncharacterized protein n=1 Tax=Kangiella taiwanensis TaxID=1079179 RepID=A0ABP8I761_9GAMM|nr:hypothetical protein [Kangiella taiwanensis]